MTFLSPVLFFYKIINLLLYVLSRELCKYILMFTSAVLFTI
jgi:hypothetical protein